MPTLLWNNAGTRRFETGLDRGVLYLSNSVGVAWNGLLSVNETKVGQEVTPLYYDGYKHFDYVSPKEYAATLTAYTYPDEFLDYQGVVAFANDVQIDNQPYKRFGLSYRTHIGNDLNEDLGYKIHILYDLIAIPSDVTYGSRSDSPELIEFEWEITSRPKKVTGYRPTSHVIVDSTKIDLDVLIGIENILYGTSSSNPQLPTIETLLSMISTLRIIDNQNGSWTAVGPDSAITIINTNVFEINSPAVSIIDSSTFEFYIP
jgi:hypothetical protein